MAAARDPGRVEFYFDPICPWAYQTSIWIRDVQSRTGLEIDWRFFSLEEINRAEGKKHPWERPWSYGWSLMRIGALLKRQDPTLLDRWYAAVGQALHEDGEPVFERQGAQRVASELGLPDDTVERAIADETTHDDVRRDHDHVVGDCAGYGVPTLIFPDGQSVFGPVVAPAPRGEAALRLWDVVRGWIEFPHLYEMRTPKRREDHEHIAREFEPYLRARKWQTIQRPVE